MSNGCCAEALFSPGLRDLHVADVQRFQPIETPGYSHPRSPDHRSRTDITEIFNSCANLLKEISQEDARHGYNAATWMAVDGHNFEFVP